ncbi:MAG TPA: hypothetical protein VFT42_08805 [Solirubrobacteraceae bacterium]|nr:hypothetical protein [Solirubrobacteraceae bacterium]
MKPSNRPSPSGEPFLFAVTAALLLAAAAISGALVVNQWLAVAFALLLVLLLTAGVLVMTARMLSDGGTEH